MKKHPLSGSEAMEVTFLDKNSLKIRGKHAGLVVNPPSREAGPMVKTTADAVLLLGQVPFNISKVEGQRLVIEEEGEYEVSGVKISSFGNKRDLAYEINIDGLDVFLANGETLKKSHDAKRECKVLILHADSIVDQSLIAALSPLVVILYGEKAQEVAKALGKESSSLKVQKFGVTLEKLPDEMQAIILG